MIITLDGPCGSGKSTLAQLLAQKLGYFYINSGYLYRSLAYILVHEYHYDQDQLHRPDLHDIQSIVDSEKLIYTYNNGIAQIFYCGHEITHHLKINSVSRDASIISADLQVRQSIVPLQRHFAMLYDLVSDGRDCGTEIYPHAQFKFYITASLQIRAERLQKDLEHKGMQLSFKEVLESTLARDQRDMQRTVCPLKKADDAIEIDTSNKSIQEVLDAMVAMILT